MKLLAYVLALLAIIGEKLTQISRVNQYAAEAQTAYARKDFSTAIFYYHYLHDSLQIRDREVKLNLAHAYFQENNQPQAFKNYQPLLTKTALDISSLVNSQLGVLVAATDKTQALVYFKNALVLNPQNETARYNYELLKKYLARHPDELHKSIPPPNPGQPRPKPTKQQENQPAGKSQNPAGDPAGNQSNANQTPSPDPNLNGPATHFSNPADSGEPTDTDSNSNQPRKEPAGTLSGDQKGVREPPAGAPHRNQRTGGREESSELDNQRQTTYERLRATPISPEKARMLLETLREAEVQYLQQLPRPRSRKTDPSKPDW